MSMSKRALYLMVGSLILGLILSEFQRPMRYMGVILIIIAFAIPIVAWALESTREPRLTKEVVEEVRRLSSDPETLILGIAMTTKLPPDVVKWILDDKLAHSAEELTNWHNNRSID